MLMGVEGLSKKLNMSLTECEKLVQIIALGSMPEVEDFHNRFNSIDTFTSGDDELDDLLGGGIREQSLFEIVGAACVAVVFLNVISYRYADLLGNLNY